MHGKKVQCLFESFSKTNFLQHFCLCVFDILLIILYFSAIQRFVINFLCVIRFFMLISNNHEKKTNYNCEISIVFNKFQSNLVQNNYQSVFDRIQTVSIASSFRINRFTNVYQSFDLIFTKSSSVKCHYTNDLI